MKASFREMNLSELRSYRIRVENRLERAQEGLSPYSMKDIDQELDRIDEVIAEKEKEQKAKKGQGLEEKQLTLDLI